MNENKVRVGMKWKRELGKKETYGEGINLVLGEGVGVVGTHAKHGDIDTVREKEIYIKMKKKNMDARFGEGMKIFVGGEGNRNERLLFAIVILFVGQQGGGRKVKRNGEKQVRALPYEGRKIFMHRFLIYLTTSVRSCTLSSFFFFSFFIVCLNIIKAIFVSR